MLDCNLSKNKNFFLFLDFDVLFKNSLTSSLSFPSLIYRNVRKYLQYMLNKMSHITIDQIRLKKIEEADVYSISS